eukprot:6314585-Amphidinium_carterae.2
MASHFELVARHNEHSTVLELVRVMKLYVELVLNRTSLSPCFKSGERGGGGSSSVSNPASSSSQPPADKKREKGGARCDEQFDPDSLERGAEALNEIDKPGP